MIILKTYLRNTARIFIFGSIDGWNVAGDPMTIKLIKYSYFNQSVGWLK